MLPSLTPLAASFDPIRRWFWRSARMRIPSNIAAPHAIKINQGFLRALFASPRLRVRSGACAIPKVPRPCEDPQLSRRALRGEDTGPLPPPRTFWEEMNSVNRHSRSEVRVANSPIVRFSMALWLAGGIALAQTMPMLDAGGRAPGFSIQTDQGKRISPSAFGGKLLVLNFWETSCAPCVAELPSLTAFAHRFRSDQVIVLAVSADEDPVKYRRFLRDHKIDLQTYRDPTRQISKSFGTDLFPETYMIQDGRIVRKVIGSIDWMNAGITSFVQRLLSP
jgi:cytochrome c biogenesis protein CcmG, thiol:disulfide interchange protein DsbE